MRAFLTRRAVARLVAIVAAVACGGVVPPAAADPVQELHPAAPAVEALVAAPSAPAGTVTSPPEWWPLRGSHLIGCAYRGTGPVCGGSYHRVWAIDVQAPEGEPVYASGAGWASVKTNDTSCSGYGRAVVVDHGPHGMSVYAHLSAFSAELAANPGGVAVDVDTVIGYVGHTGSTSRCDYDHLHYEEASTDGRFGSGADDPGPFRACVDGAEVSYPQRHGRASWQGFPGHAHRARHDGTACASTRSIEPEWTAWESVDGDFAAGPSVVLGPTGRRHLFSVAGDGDLVQRWWTPGGTWQPAGGSVQDLGAPPGLDLVGAPSALSRQPGQINVVARASDDAVWHRWYTPALGWSAWESLGGVVSSAPAAASWSRTHLAVFARGRDGRTLWQRTYDGGWGPWRRVGGVATSAPAATSRGDGRLDLAVRGADEALWHRHYDRGSGWSSWRSLGGRLAEGGRPGIVANDPAPGRLDVLVVSPGGALYRRSYALGRGWHPEGYEVLGTPGTPLHPATAAIPTAPNRLELYARGHDDRMHLRRQE